MYYRKYYKIQDLAAQVGGIFKLLGLTFYAISKLTSEHEYFQTLINNYFDFKKDTIKQPIKSHSSRGQGIYGEKEIKTTKNEIIQFHSSILNKRNKKLKLSFFEKII